MYTIYSKPACAYCDKAKQLLTSRELTYREIIVDVGQQKVDGATYISVAELKAMFPDVRTVPVILYNGERIGGFTELQRQLQNA